MAQIKIAYLQLKTIDGLFILIMFTTLLEVYINGVVIFIQGAFSNIGLTDNSIAIVLGIVTLFGVIGAYLSRYLTNVKVPRFFLLLAIVFILSCLMISLDYKFVMISGFIIFNLLLDISYLYISDRMNNIILSETRATILSFSNSLGGIISLFFYPVLGWSIEKFGYSTSFFIIGSVFFLGLFYLFVLSNSKERSL